MVITGKIDVTKIDKTKLFKGSKGTYLDIVLIETPNSQYGDYMIKQSVSKEDREAGIDGVILGSCEIRGKVNKPIDPVKSEKPVDPIQDGEDHLPF